MRTLHLIGDDEMYTNLAFLLSEQCTHMIKLAVFEGSKKSVFKDRRERSGSLLEQMEEAFDYIERYNRTRAEFSGLDRLDMRDYPPEAIREALLNAIVHRDYSFSGAALISIFEDRIPVFLKENSRHRKFGCWYLRIRPKNKVSGPIEGIIKIEKMAVLEEEEGLNPRRVHSPMLASHLA